MSYLSNVYKVNDIFLLILVFTRGGGGLGVVVKLNPKKSACVSFQFHLNICPFEVMMVREC